MGRLSARIPMTPPRSKRKPKIKVLRTLSGHQTPVEKQALFQHAVHQGDTDFSPHSLGDQIVRGRDNAMVRGFESFKKAIDHTHDHAFTYLSPSLTLVNYNQIP